MGVGPQALSSGQPARIDLKTYAPSLPLGTLTVGIDNIHHDVFFSPRFVEFARAYLSDLMRQATSLAYPSALEVRPVKAPETTALKKVLAELMQASLTRAKYEKNIEVDVLFRLALLKFLAQEIGDQFSNLVLEGKEWIRSRGAHFEQTEQAHVMKARLAELQAGRRNIYRQAGQQIWQILVEVEETVLGKSRRALFGDPFGEIYEVLQNRLVLVEGGKDDLLYLEHYVLLGNYFRDQDRFETFDQLLVEFLREFVVASDQAEEMRQAWRTHDTLLEEALRVRAEISRLEEDSDNLLRKLERHGDALSWVWPRSDPATLRAALADVEHRRRHLQRKLEELDPKLETAKRRAEFLTEKVQSRLHDYLDEPENARRLFDASWPEPSGEEAAHTRAQLLEEWVRRLEQRDLLLHVLASYELRNLYHDYCPPVHLQQLRRALVYREESKRVEQILQQFPARRFSIKRIEELAKKLRRYRREEVQAIALRFAEDFMRLHRDLRNLQLLSAGMERINLIRAERVREISRLNNSLYEFLLPDEARPAEDRVVSHVIIKADVRDSTRITQDLLARGLNPASHLSLNLYEPLKRILERFGAAKVFIEGDAIVLAIFETDANRLQHHAVARACILAREILAISQAYNDRAESSDLPRLELGVGIAYQNSPPTYWIDGDSRIMISRALNLSDRLSGCSRAARRLLPQNPSHFRLFVFQTVMAGTADEEVDEFLIRFNLNGVELNEEGFAKLAEEISLESVETECPLPWGRQRVTLYIGEIPIGETFEPIVIRKGYVRQLLSDGRIGETGTHAYYEVCTSKEVLTLAEALLRAAVRKH